MLTVAVVLALHATPSLLAPEMPLPLEMMTREQLTTRRDELAAKRPGLFLPVSLFTVGVVGAGILGVAFWVPFSTPYGLATSVAVLMIAAFVTALAVAVTGIAIYWRNKHDRDELGDELDHIDAALRDGRCRSTRKEPCKRDPLPFFEQVKSSGPEPSVLLATF